MTVFISLKPFFSTTRKCVEYFVLGLTFKGSLGNESFKVNTFKLIWNVDFLLLLLCFILFFVREKYFTAKVFNMHTISMGLAHLQPSRTSTVELLWENKKKFILDVRLGSKYASGISFTVEKLYRMSIFV